MSGGEPMDVVLHDAMAGFKAESRACFHGHTPEHIEPMLEALTGKSRSERELFYTAAVRDALGDASVHPRPEQIETWGGRLPTDPEVRRVMFVLNSLLSVEYCPMLPVLADISTREYGPGGSLCVLMAFVRASRKRPFYLPLTEAGHAAFVLAGGHLARARVPQAVRALEKAGVDVPELFSHWLDTFFLVPFGTSAARPILCAFQVEGGKIFYRMFLGALKTFMRDIAELDVHLGPPESEGGPHRRHLPPLVSSLDHRIFAHRGAVTKAAVAGFKFKRFGKKMLYGLQDGSLDAARAWVQRRRENRLGHPTHIPIALTTVRGGADGRVGSLIAPADALAPEWAGQLPLPGPGGAQHLRLLYTTSEDGWGLARMLHHVRDEVPLVLLVRTTADALFGAVMHAPLNAARVEPGTPNDFLFSVRPQFAVYQATGLGAMTSDMAEEATAEAYVMRTDTLLAFGSSVHGARSGLRLDGSFETGSSEACDTYANEPLHGPGGSGGRFDVACVEVYELRPGHGVPSA